MSTYCDCWKSQYKSMSFVQLLSVKLPLTLRKRERLEHAEYILQELRLKAPRDCVLDPGGPSASKAALGRDIRDQFAIRSKFHWSNI